MRKLCRLLLFANGTLDHRRINLPVPQSAGLVFQSAVSACSVRSDGCASPPLPLDTALFTMTVAITIIPQGHKKLDNTNSSRTDALHSWAIPKRCVTICTIQENSASKKRGGAASSVFTPTKRPSAETSKLRLWSRFPLPHQFGACWKPAKRLSAFSPP